VKRQTARRVGIVSVGKYMPPHVVTNFDLEQMVDTSDEWIRERTGIVERHLARNGERQSDLAVRASREALARVGWSPKDLDLIVVGTVTPDYIFPSSANMLAGKLGAIGTPSYDVLAACSGFMYSLWQAVGMVESGRASRALVVGSEIMSAVIDWEDRTTCVLFGDGAGAVLLEKVDEPYGIYDVEIGSDGRFYDLLHMEAGGSANPATHETVEKRMHYLRMEGGEVFKLAVRKMTEISEALLERNHVRPDQLGCFIAHQANIRIIDATTKRLGLKPSQVYNNIDKYGNTTSATIPTCIYEAEEQGIIKKGDWVLLVSFGAGLTWAGILLRWAVDRLPKLEEITAEMATDSLSEKLRPGGDWPRR
jgi:3-oxoacyl-[acyl-carrier-protein] synthase-3